MKLSHKKVFDTIQKKFGFTYRKGDGGYEPTNYHIFESGESKIKIELIPASRQHFKTIYVMFFGRTLKNEEEISSTIEHAYTEQRTGTPCEWVLAFNTSRPSQIF